LVPEVDVVIEISRGSGLATQIGGATVKADGKTVVETAH
jgi:hypothetical protein